MSQKAKRSSEYLTPTMFDIKLLNFFVNVVVNLVDPFKIIRKFIYRPVTTTLMSMFDEYKQKTIDRFDGSQSIILRVFVIVSIGFLLFCGAVLMYVLFYLMYMPSSAHVKPVHMQFSSICEDIKSCDIQTMTSPYHSFPIAHLQLNKNQLMMVGQAYNIYARLEVPETPRNQDLGVFMICVNMKDKDKYLRSHACRSTMLRYRSPLLQKAKMLLFIPFYIFGIREEAQVLDVEIFNKYVDTPNSVTDIYVEIQSKVVEFYAVSLHITAHFTGLRFIIFHFPLVSACVGIAINFVVLVAITLALWYHYDYEMDWIDEARRKYTGKSKSEERKESSSISTVDENASMFDDDFMFDTDHGDRRKSTPEE